MIFQILDYKKMAHIKIWLMTLKNQVKMVI